MRDHKSPKEDQGGTLTARQLAKQVAKNNPRLILSRIFRPSVSPGQRPQEPLEPEPAAGESSQPAPVAAPEPPRRRPVLDGLTDELRDLNAATAQKVGVTAAVHDKDFVYWYCATHERHTAATGINHYFQDGALSARKLAELISSLGYGPSEKVKLLEFASGYGCVTRHLKKYPGLDLVSSDIHFAAMEFIAKELGGKTLLSAHSPEDFCPPNNFDVVFALSFFTHMPKSTFGPWLKALFSAVAPSGHLAFTTHGLKKCTDFAIKPEDIPSDGFWFQPLSDQKDLDTGEYGTTMTTPECVIGEIYRALRSPIAVFKPDFWWGDQDLWVVKREP